MQPFQSNINLNVKPTIKMPIYFNKNERHILQQKTL